MKTAAYMFATDIHVAGEMFRVVPLSCWYPRQENMDDYQRMISEDALFCQFIREPRGHKDMYLCVLTPPVSACTQAGIVIMSAEGLCRYHAGAYFAAAAYFVEVEGLREQTVRFDGVAGNVEVMVDAGSEDGRLKHVALRECASKKKEDNRIFVREQVIQGEKTGLDLSVNMIEHVRTAFSNAKRVYPLFDILFLYNEQTFLTVTAGGHIDRSPVSGAMAYAQLLGVNGVKRIKNFLGHKIDLEGDGQCANLYVTPVVISLLRFVVHPDDPLKEGFWIR